MNRHITESHLATSTVEETDISRIGIPRTKTRSVNKSNIGRKVNLPGPGGNSEPIIGMDLYYSVIDNNSKVEGLDLLLIVNHDVE